MWEELKLSGRWKEVKRGEKKSLFNKEQEVRFIFLLYQHILALIILQVTKWNLHKGHVGMTIHSGLNETPAKAMLWHSILEEW